MSNANERDIQAILAVHEQAKQAENNADFDLLSTTVTDDVVVMPPNMPQVAGREAAIQFMRAFLGQFELKIDYVSEETQVHGDVAFNRGTYSHTLTPRSGGTPVPEKGKFLWVYTRLPDSSWKASRVMWSPNHPPSLG